MNKFYTFLVIPEKNQQVKKIVVPTVHLRIAFIIACVAAFFLAFMAYDYAHVIQQLTENKRLQIENRQLKQQIQTFTSKLQNVENALERIQTYTAKLRIITNQTGDVNIENLKKRVLPEIKGDPMDDHSPPPPPARDEEKEQSLYLYPNHYNTHFLLASNSFSDTVKVMLEQQQQPKKIDDLLREDEERESEALKSDFNKLNLAFEKVLQHGLSVELDIQSLHIALQDQKDFLNSTPTLKPSNGEYSSGFGVQRSIFTDRKMMHEGVDIANHIGTPIYAPAAGIVSYASARAGYGNLLTIDHGYGIQTQYGHVSKMFVHTGERVRRGEKIAAIGNAGRSTGPHLHYEVRINGVPFDPRPYILED